MTATTSLVTINLCAAASAALSITYVWISFGLLTSAAEEELHPVPVGAVLLSRRMIFGELLKTGQAMREQLWRGHDVHTTAACTAGVLVAAMESVAGGRLTVAAGS